MVKSHRSKRHTKKHRGGEGEETEENSVLNMDETPAETKPVMPKPVTTTTTTTTAMPGTAADEEKKGLMDTVKGWFGGSKTKRVRFRTMRKSKHSSTKRSGTKSKRSSTKRSTKKSKRSSAKRSSAKRSGSKKRKGSSRK